MSVGIEALGRKSSRYLVCGTSGRKRFDERAEVVDGISISVGEVAFDGCDEGKEDISEVSDKVGFLSASTAPAAVVPNPVLKDSDTVLARISWPIEVSVVICAVGIGSDAFTTI